MDNRNGQDGVPAKEAIAGEQRGEMGHEVNMRKSTQAEVDARNALLQSKLEAQPLPGGTREEAIKVYAEWAGVSEAFLRTMANNNPERTGWNASVLMTERALAAEATNEKLLGIVTCPMCGCANQKFTTNLTPEDKEDLETFINNFGGI